MIVLDVGCRTHGEKNSVAELIDYYAPDLLLGWDLLPDLVEGTTCIKDTIVVTRRGAAWTYTGHLKYLYDGIHTRISDAGREHVPCFDIAAVVEALPTGDGLILKVDVEGTEMTLLRHLLHRGVASNITELLVRWHADHALGDSGERALVEEDWPGGIRTWWL